MNKKFSKLKVEVMRHFEEGECRARQSIENRQTTKDYREHSKCRRALAMTDKIFMTSDNFSLAQRVGVRVSMAFTLAEVLITLVVVGVVAAVTVPMFIHQEGERVNSERQANIVYKIAQATDMMKANGNLGKFSSTDEFIDELQKYLKINKRCDSEHIAECWTTEKVKTMSGEEYEVKNAKTRKDLLGDETNHPDNPNVGIILADGANIILTYNPDFEGIAAGDTTVHTAGLLPVGNGKEEFLNYTSDTMGGLAFVVDVNGNRSPNSEKQGDSYKDIRNFNGAKFTATQVEIPIWASYNNYELNGTHYFKLDTTYKFSQAQSACPEGTTFVGKNTTHRMGNGGTCYDCNGYTFLVQACKDIKNDAAANNKTNPFTSGTYWSASYAYPDYSRTNNTIYVNFANCNYNYGSSTNGNSYNVMCMAN